MNDPVLTVVIPTMPGREEYLDRAVRGYRERTVGDVRVIVVEGAQTCGIGWQVGAERAVEEGTDFLHLSADDIVPDWNWNVPLAETVAGGAIPCCSIIVPIKESLDPETQMPIAGAPFGREQFFERVPSSSAEVADWQETKGDSEYPAAPFCSVHQWELIGPMIPTTYGTDKWFGLRAKRAGFRVVARHNARLYHYVAQAGRAAYPGWFHLDTITFDMCIAYAEYDIGVRDPSEPHPLRGTDEGARLAREWYERNVGTRYWEASE